MATKDLKVFLQKIEKDLRRTSEEYRKQVSDVKVHTFYLSKQGLQDHIAYQLAVDAVTISKRDLEKLSGDFYNALKNAFMGTLENVEIFDRKGNSTEFFITFRSKSRVRGPLPTLDARKTFDSIKYIYHTPRMEFLNKLEVYYKNSKQKLYRSNFLDLGHANDSAVVKQRVQDLLQFGEVPKRLSKIPEVETVLRLKKDDDKDTIAVSLESASANRNQGRTEERNFKIEVQKDIRKAIEKLDTLRQTGSDNAITRTRKRTIKRVVEPFTKIKGVTTKLENIKVNKSSKSPVELPIKTKVTNVASKGMKRASSIPKGKQTKGRQSTVNISTLIGILNAKLPDTVAGNMGSPRLENRTGRFANSVRVLDVTQTRAGFPSIGYTYQRQPYGVFEATSGSRFSSSDRDPRTLIDASIREIAAQYALGRLYTRRV